MLFSELVGLFLKYNEQHRAPRTAEFYALQLGKVAKRYGHLQAMELQPWHLLELRETWHLVLAVQRLYRWAVDEKGILAVNPMLKLKRPRLGARKRVLSARDLAKVLRCCRADFRRLMIAARETAGRPGEMRELTWEDLRWRGPSAAQAVELEAGRAWFELVEYKGRTRRSDATETRVIPISARLGRLLVRLGRRSPREGLIFKTVNGLAWNRNSLRWRMKRVRERSKLPERIHGERIVCYTVRHSTATNLAALGMQTSILQLLLGHADISTTQRYVHLRKRHLLEAWKRFHERPQGPTN